MNAKNEKIIKYLIENITKEKNGCWVWNTKPNSNGYGRACLNYKVISSHRLVYKYFKGKIPLEKQIDHLCRNRICVNPEHLEAVSQQENMARGLGNAAQNSRKTHCFRGHLLSG